MVDAEDYVSGASVEWRRLATTLFGSGALALVYGITQGFQTLYLGALGLLESAGLTVARIWTRAVGIVLNGYNVALGEFEAAVVWLGPIAVPVSAIVVVGMLWVTSEVVDRVGV